MALAKTTRPRADGVLARPRLYRFLDRSAPLTWVSAPPGAGKTTLVASWVAARRLVGLWYQLDAGDGDPGSFFHFLRLAAPQGRAPLPVLTSDYRGALAEFVRRFCRDLFARFQPPFAVVLDD